MLRITEEPDDDRHRLLLAGDLDMSTAVILDERVDRLIRDGKHNLEINLTHVQFMDSKALACLISTRRKLRGDTRSLALSGVRPSLMKVFEVTGLVAYFTFI